MREKLTWSIVGLLVAMLLALHGQSSAHPEPQIGRFQIVTVAPGGDEGSPVYRIDTATGKTQVRVVASGGKMMWSAPMPEFSSQPR
jgi:hypothetical protein